MWTVNVPIFEEDGEDEQALISEFVRLSVIYPDQDPYKITEYVFRNLRDPVSRATQAAALWPKDVEILERIREARLSNNNSKEVDSLQNKLLKLESIYNNENTPAKERIAAIQLHTQMKGELKKLVESSDDAEYRPPAQIILSVYDDGN